MHTPSRITIHYRCGRKKRKTHFLISWRSVGQTLVSYSSQPSRTICDTQCSVAGVRHFLVDYRDRKPGKITWQGTQHVAPYPCGLTLPCALATEKWGNVRHKQRPVRAAHRGAGYRRDGIIRPERGDFGNLQATIAETLLLLRGLPRRRHANVPRTTRERKRANAILDHILCRALAWPWSNGWCRPGRTPRPSRPDASLRKAGRQPRRKYRPR